MCKAVLHHSECSVPPKREKDAQLYAGGRLTGSFLQHLLKSYNGDMADIVTSLMLKFNLISRVSDDGSSSEEFIVPSNLRDGAPACLPSPLACRGPLPTVLVGLRFFTSTIPLALFETSLASVLSWMHKCKIDPDCWKHGIQCRANKVTLSYQRIEDRLEIKASAEAPRNLWEVLHPVLRAIGEHVINMWKGAMPKCTFACPGCRCCGVHDQDRSPNVRDNVTLEELIASDRPMYDWYCDSCRMDIPRILVFPRLQELITDKDCKEVADFIERLKNNCENRISPADRKKPTNMLKRNTNTIVQRLGKSEANAIADVLYSQGHISKLVKNDIQEERERFSKVRNLLDAVKDRGDKASTAFIEALEMEDLDRKDLADEIRADK